MPSQYSLKLLVKAALAAAALLGVTPAFAEKTSGFYVGGGVGVGYARNLDNYCDNNLPAQGAVATQCDKQSFAWKAFGGYQFIRYFGVELGYYDFRKAKIKTTSGGEIEFKTRGPYAGIVATAPLLDRLSFIGRVGVVHWHTKLEADASSGIAGQSENGFTAAFGAGLEYMFTDALGLRGEWERLQKVGHDTSTGRTKIDLFTVSGLVRF
jgi:OmpA-OmpF porin, OOP family